MSGPSGTPARKRMSDNPVLRRIVSYAVLIGYLLFLLVPIYWLVNMSFKPNVEILNRMTLLPENPTTRNYVEILTDPTWYMGYVHSLTYVLLNTIISVSVALPAA